MIKRMQYGARELLCIRIPYLCSFNTNLLVRIFSQDWRLNTLWKVDSDQARLINKLEKVWFGNADYQDQYVICDQMAMVAALDEKSILDVKDHWVIIAKSIFGIMFLFYNLFQRLAGNRGNIGTVYQGPTRFGTQV